jgi:hypothetical protein
LTIFGIPDHSRKVTWSFLFVLAIAFAGLILVRRSVDPAAMKGLFLVFAGLWGAFMAYVVFSAGLRRHPASRISELLRSGKIDEACVLGAELLRLTPTDPLVQLNCVAAHYAAGDLVKARQILASIKPEKLPRMISKVYAHWNELVNPPKSA